MCNVTSCAIIIVNTCSCAVKHVQLLTKKLMVTYLSAVMEQSYPETVNSFNLTDLFIAIMFS